MQDRRDQRDGSHGRKVLPRYGERFGSRVEHAVENLDEQVRECPCGHAAGDKPGAGRDARFCPDERTELPSIAPSAVAIANVRRPR